MTFTPRATRAAVDVHRRVRHLRLRRVPAPAAHVVPGVITPTQPKVPEANIRGSPKGFQWVILRLERVQGVLKGVPRGPVGPPGPPELAAPDHAAEDARDVHAREGLRQLEPADVGVGVREQPELHRRGGRGGTRGDRGQGLDSQQQGQ